MGVVYEARQISRDRKVAVKFLTERALGIPGGPDLPAGTPYISMEWIDGRPLSSLIGTPELRDLDSQLAIAVQVAEGLAVAHGHGIVHRDIKPGNVMVTRDGHVKIVDFGLAKPVISSAGSPEDTTETLSDELTREGWILGTVVYMSPEQAMAKTARLGDRDRAFEFLKRAVGSSRIRRWP